MTEEQQNRYLLFKYLTEKFFKAGADNPAKRRRKKCRPIVAIYLDTIGLAIRKNKS